MSEGKKNTQTPAPGEPTSGSYKEQVEKRVSEEAVEDLSKPAKSGDPPMDFVLRCLNANELGDGLLFAWLFNDKYRYLGRSGEWMIWSEHYWKIDKVTPDHLARSDVDKVAEVYDRARAKWLENLREAQSAGASKSDVGKLERRIKDLKARVERLRSDRGRFACLAFARDNPASPLAISGDEIDQEPFLLACSNGVIDLQTGELHPGKQNEYLVRHSPIEFHGLETPCPTFETFLLSSMDEDLEMVNFLQRLFGYGLLGQKRSSTFPVLIGRGRNGKSVLTEIIQQALGEDDDETTLAGPIQSEMLLDQGKTRSSAGPSPDIMTLKGLRIAFASETDEGQTFSLSRVKWLSGDDKLTGRYPHDKRNTSFKPSHILVLSTNHKPRVRGADEYAFWERVYLINFPLSFVTHEPKSSTERKADPNLKTKLQNELEGILAWLVKGCLLYQRDGLNPPDKVLQDTSDYKLDEDIIAQFVNACCEEDPKAETGSSELYKVFNWWYCKTQDSRRPLPQRTFGRMLKVKYKD